MELEDINRREFLMMSAMMTAAACSSGDRGASITPPIIPPTNPPEGPPVTPPAYTLPTGARILFQGDSITSSDRYSGTLDPNSAPGMGVGYAMIVAQHILLSQHKKQPLCFNRAIGGDTVDLLQARWQTDTIDVKPDLLSIMIGVNDYIHVTADVYERNYKTLIDTTKAALPNTKFVILEPYVATTIPAGSPDFTAIRTAARSVAEYADAFFVPVHEMLNKLVSEDSQSYWTADGTHPTLAGSAAIASKWLEVVGL